MEYLATKTWHLTAIFTCTDHNTWYHTVTHKRLMPQNAVPVTYCHARNTYTSVHYYSYNLIGWILVFYLSSHNFTASFHFPFIPSLTTTTTTPHPLSDASYRLVASKTHNTHEMYSAYVNSGHFKPDIHKCMTKQQLLTLAIQTPIWIPLTLAVEMSIYWAIYTMIHPLSNPLYRLCTHTTNDITTST